MLAPAEGKDQKQNKTKASGIVPQNPRRGQDSEASDTMKKVELAFTLKNTVPHGWLFIQEPGDPPTRHLLLQQEIGRYFSEETESGDLWPWTWDLQVKEWGRGEMLS